MVILIGLWFVIQFSGGTSVCVNYQKEVVAFIGLRVVSNGLLISIICHHKSQLRVKIF